MLCAMYQDVADLNAFYRSRLGQLTRRVVLARVRAILPDLAGESLLGLGYATPYLRVFSGEAERVLGLCPAAQGVIRWPNDGPSQVALIEEDASGSLWPDFQDAIIPLYPP